MVERRSSRTRLTRARNRLTAVQKLAAMMRSSSSSSCANGRPSVLLKRAMAPIGAPSSHSSGTASAVFIRASTRPGEPAGVARSDAGAARRLCSVLVRKPRIDAPSGGRLAPGSPRQFSAASSAGFLASHKASSKPPSSSVSSTAPPIASQVWADSCSTPRISSSCELARPIVLSSSKRSFRCRTLCSSFSFVSSSCMFFCTTDKKRRLLSMETAASVAKALSSASSLAVKSRRLFLLSTWTTPMIRPKWFFMGAARMDWVR